MQLYKCAKHAFKMVLHSQLRSWLTIIGIVIGVAAVIAIVSIGDGMQAALNARLGGLGADIITITPGFSRGGGFRGMGEGGGGGGGGGAVAAAPVLEKRDLQTLKAIPEIMLVDTEIRGSANVTYLGKSGRVSVTGVDQRVWPQITTSTIKEGRTLNSADQNVILIGGRLASSYFGQPLGINKMISIEGSAFRVVGVLDDQSNSIYMPIQMAYQVIDSKTNGQYDTLVVKIKNQDQLDAAEAKITSRLMIARHVTQKNQDFSVISSKQIQQTIADTLSAMTTFLLAIAAVSLIVGAVGIANTMFTSVLEKTREIGIMKAIGARNHDILLIFLFNSAFIGLVGGALGILLGTALSTLIPGLLSGAVQAGGRGGFTTLVSMRSVAMALSVSIGVGILAGIVPAYRASQLKPVEALRYE